MKIGLQSGADAVRRACALAAVALALIAAPAAAQTRNPFESGPLEEKHYNPESRSYFELRAAPPNINLGWDAASRMARASEYKGVRGQLAIVDDIATHEFLRDTFFLSEPSWIGLRFWCGVRKLSWADGTVHELTAFKAWARPWMATPRGGRACSRGVVAHPVIYTPHARGFLWQAVPAEARLRYYFVEYPTGGEDGPAPAAGAASGVEKTAEQP